jgi:hypothetical protein
MVIYQDKDFKIINTCRNYVLVNKRGTKENHGHFKKPDTCHLMIKLIRKMEVPKSKYLQDAALRISINEDYKNKIFKKRDKQHYVNINKGTRA